MKMLDTSNLESSSTMHSATGDARLDIIIVSWNTRTLLEDCLASLFKPLEKAGTHRGLPVISGYSLNIVVVDNGSRDGSPQMVREQFPSVRLIENPDNVGFPRANNQAIRESSGRYVLLLNSDTRVLPGALETLIGFMDAHPEAGVAGARLLNTDGTLQISCYPEPTLRREIWRLFHLDALRPYASYPMNKWRTDQPQDVDVVLGACLIIRRSVLQQVGLLDESYFMYSEEVDLCYRIRRGGWKVWWVPEARVVHHGGQSTRQVATAMFLRLYASKVRYFRKHHGSLAAHAYKLILLFAALFRLLLTPVAFLERTDARKQHLALADHYRRLIGTLPGL
jgi:GT2 family glycosyltransferase